MIKLRYLSTFLKLSFVLTGEFIKTLRNWILRFFSHVFCYEFVECREGNPGRGCNDPSCCWNLTFRPVKQKNNNNDRITNTSWTAAGLTFTLRHLHILIKEQCLYQQNTFSYSIQKTNTWNFISKKTICKKSFKINHKTACAWNAVSFVLLNCKPWQKLTPKLGVSWILISIFCHYWNLT